MDLLLMGVAGFVIGGLIGAAIGKELANDTLRTVVNAQHKLLGQRDAKLNDQARVIANFQADERRRRELRENPRESIIPANRRRYEERLAGNGK